MQPQTQVISGQTAATPFQAAGPIVPVRSEAPKIFGIILMILGSIGVLLSLVSMLGMALLGSWAGGLETGGEVSVEDLETIAMLGTVDSFVGLIASVAIIVGGYFLTQYQKMGVWILLGATALQMMVGIVIAFLTPSQEAMASGALGAGIEVFCGLICGVIYAIPLMISNNGLE